MKRLWNHCLLALKEWYLKNKLILGNNWLTIILKNGKSDQRTDHYLNWNRIQSLPSERSVGSWYWTAFRPSFPGEGVTSDRRVGATETRSRPSDQIRDNKQKQLEKHSKQLIQTFKTQRLWIGGQFRDQKPSESWPECVFCRLLWPPNGWPLGRRGIQSINTIILND